VLHIQTDESTPNGDTKRPTAVVRAGAPKALPIAGGKGSVRLFLEQTSASIAVDEITAEAGVKIPAHRHESSDELVHIISGKGTTFLGGKELAVMPGVTLRFPAGAEHALVVHDKLIAVQVYAPRGPEQRFKGGEVRGAK
jgi:quercetin dioxygenase-like cupin family protein